MIDRHRRTGTGRHERGVISVLAAVWLVVAIAALGAIDVGNMFYMRRNLQGVADMAASAAAQVVDDGCTRAPTTAQGNAGANGFDATTAGSSIATVCGRWDTTMYAAPSYFLAGATPANAVQVTVTKSVPYFFLGPARTASATATAKAVNLGAFTIGTTLASVDPATLTGVLNALLGTNIGPTAISIAGYQGLANSRIEVGDLMAALGAGSVDQLLATRVTAGQLASVMLTALQTTKVLNASASAAIGALQTIVNANISGPASFAIGNTSSAAGVLSVGLANTQSALHATLSPFDALMVAAEVAQAGKAAVNVSAGLNVPPLLTSSLQLQVIQPPSLAVGEAGKTAGGQWRTIAKTAQVRAILNVAVGQVSLTVLGITLAKTGINLPLYVDAAPGTAWLQSTTCAATKAASTSTIGVQTGIANVCVSDTAPVLPPTVPASCPAATLLSLNVVLLGGLVKVVTNNLGIQAVAPNATLTFDGVVGNSDDVQSTNSNAIGSVLYNALANSGGLTVTLLGIPVAADVSPVLTLLKPLLAPAPPTPSVLDAALMPIFQLLGAQIGESTIHDQSLTCGQSQLAY
jgi:uncharacterized membrane protein